MDRVIVVTGGTSGLGQAAAIEFAKDKDRVLVVGRDAERGAQTVAEAPGAEFIAGDVATKAGVKAVADAIRGRTPRVDVLVNNAGAVFFEMGRTADGLEQTFALNVFGPYLLERMLHAEIAAAKGRIVNVATQFLDRYPVDLDDLQNPKKYGGYNQYGAAKNALVMLTVEQGSRYAAEGVRAVSLNPSIIMGTRFGGGQPRIAQILAGPIMRLIGIGTTMEEAVRRLRVAAFDPVPNGAYLSKGEPAPLPVPAQDETARKRLMGILDSLAAARSVS